MSQSDLTFSDLGPVAPTAEEVLARQHTIWQTALGNNINTNAATPQGQLMSSLAAIVQDKNNQLLYLANMFNPATSYGMWQDALGAIYFIDRQQATNTQVQVTCTGLTGTVIAGEDTTTDPARVKTEDGYELKCLTTGTIGNDGTITLPFECEEAGDIEIEAHSVTKIVKAQPGWDTVDNEEVGVTGRLLESQWEFEKRRKQSVAYNSRSMLSSVYSRVGNLDGVIDLLARQNRNDYSIEDNGVTMTPHSIYICVLGGDENEIAEAIYNTVSGGCDYNGNTSVSYKDPLTGAMETIKFQRPSKQGFAITVNLRKNSSTPNDIVSKVKENIYADFYGEEYPNSDTGTAHETSPSRVTIGENVYASRFYCPAISAGASQLINITIGSDDGSVSQGDNFQLYNFQYPELDMENITVNVVED